LAGVERDARDLPVPSRKRDSERAGERAQAHRRPPGSSEILACLAFRYVSALLTLRPGIVEYLPLAPSIAKRGPDEHQAPRPPTRRM
jgi:hypothetical protein